MFKLGYSEAEIDCAFTEINNGDATLDDLCLELGIEFGSPTIRQAAIDKVDRYDSALAVIKMKMGA
jgi:hypothetical protein